MVDSVPDSDPLGRLAEEFLDRQRRGEQPTVEGYAQQHPHLADSIRAFFPALLVVEDLKPDYLDATGSFPGGSGFRNELAPTRLGDYRVIREIGRGGMGVVYEAEQESLGRRVALKVLGSSARLDAQRIARFHREAKAAARLHHTNIVPVFGVGEVEGVHYYVMQYIAGAGLDQVIEDVRRLQGSRSVLSVRGRPETNGGDLCATSSRSCPDGARQTVDAPEDDEALSVTSATMRGLPSPSVISTASEPGQSYGRSVAQIGVQVAEALVYAHEQGTLHRDIKPANVLLDLHGVAWVTDFGLAKASADDDLTHTGDIVGTIRYMAPERFHGRCDARSDIYGLGLTLYELLARRPAFDAADRNMLIRQVEHVEPARLRKLDPSLPRDLETIVHKAIEKDPTHRYDSAESMAADLRCFLEDRPIRARRATTFERAWRWSRRNRAMAALAALAMASLIAAAVVGWVGYVSTTRALEGESRRRLEAETARARADENVALSLEVFEELFQRLAPEDSLPPPPLGLSIRHGGVPHELVPLGWSIAQGTMPNPGGGFPFPSLGLGRTETVSTLLRTVLSFYDRFAALNVTNARLQGEAAWAYRKVGVINERLGRLAEAESAYARAGSLLEELIALAPDTPEYRFKLVQTYDIADPWSAEPSSLEALNRRLERARGVIDQLAAASPDDLAYAYARIHVHAKLGMTLHRRERSEEAEAAYRRALAIQGELLARLPRNPRAAYDRTATREALATLLIERGREDEARALLIAAAEELHSLVVGDGTHRPPPDLFRRLAASFESTGDAERSEAMNRLAESLSKRSGPELPGVFPGSTERPELGP